MTPEIPFSSDGEIDIDGRTELKLPPGDHTLCTKNGIYLEVRQGCALVGAEGGFDWVGVSNSNDGPGAPRPFRGSVMLNPGGTGRFRVQDEVIFDVRPSP